MKTIKLQTALKEMSDFLNKEGIDGVFQYVGEDNVLIRSRKFKDEELYDPVKHQVYIKGITLNVQDINDSHYPALIFKIGELLRCKYQAHVEKEIHYIVEDVSGYEVVDEDLILDLLDVTAIELPILSIEVSDRYLEIEIDNMDTIDDDVIKEKMQTISNCYCIIDRINSVVTISMSSVLQKLKPDNSIKRVNNKIFIENKNNK